MAKAWAKVRGQKIGGGTQPSEAIIADTQRWYAEYYRTHGRDRNDLLCNPEVLFQTFAFDAANIRALSRVPLDRGTASVLDVGCGSGTSLLAFLRLGFRARNLSGIDVNPARVAMGLEEFPNLDLRCEDATAMSYPSETFDLVSESTMFVQLTDDNVAQGIANEMIRVTKVGGFIFLTDWRYGKPGNPDYLALSPARIARLFDVGSGTERVCLEHGAIVPPVGRRLSKWLPSLYFAFQRVLPLSVGQTTTVLRKIASAV